MAHPLSTFLANVHPISLSLEGRSVQEWSGASVIDGRYAFDVFGHSCVAPST